MTQLEFVAKIGSDSLNIVRIYSKGHLTLEEMTGILGKDRTELIRQYMGSVIPFWKPGAEKQGTTCLLENSLTEGRG